MTAGRATAAPRLARGCACIALTLAAATTATVTRPAHAAAAHALRLQLELAVAGSSNPALDEVARRAAGSGELNLRVPYALATERGGLAIDLHANTRSYSARELERARDVGAELRWSTRTERSTSGASLRLGRRSLDDRLDAGIDVFDVTRERDEGELALDHVQSLTPRLRTLASLRGTRIRHERVDGEDEGDLLDYDVLAAGVRLERDLTRGPGGDGPTAAATRVVGIDLDVTEYRPSAPAAHTRTVTAAASGRWRPTAVLAMEGRVGLSHQRRDAGTDPTERADSAWTPAFDLSLRHALPTFDTTLNVSRSLRPTAAGGLTRNTAVSLDFRQRTEHDQALYATATWTRIDPGTASDTRTSPRTRRLADLEGTTLALQAGVQWQVLPSTSADLSWRYARNDRGDGRAAHDHTARLAFVYRPDGARW